MLLLSDRTEIYESNQDVQPHDLNVSAFDYSGLELPVKIKLQDMVRNIRDRYGRVSKTLSIQVTNSSL